MNCLLTKAYENLSQRNKLSILGSSVDRTP